MKVVVINTEKYAGYICPSSGKHIYFDPGSDDFLDTDQLMSETIIQGVVIPEVSGVIDCSTNPLISRWNASCIEAEEQADENDEWFDIAEFIEDYEDEDLIAIEITTFGMACGPVALTVYHLVREADWDKVQMIDAD